jgi:hypothetical protein
MTIPGGRAVIVLASFLGVVACSTPDKRQPESAGRPIDAAQAGGLSALGDAQRAPQETLRGRSERRRTID